MQAMIESAIFQRFGDSLFSGKASHQHLKHLCIYMGQQIYIFVGQENKVNEDVLLPIFQMRKRFDQDGNEVIGNLLIVFTDED